MDAAFGVVHTVNPIDSAVDTYAKIGALLGLVIGVYVFYRLLRGFRAAGGFSGVLWGLIPAALGSALVAVFSAFAWPLASIVFLVMVGTVRVTPVPTFSPDFEARTERVLRSR